MVIRFDRYWRLKRWVLRFDFSSNIEKKAKTAYFSNSSLTAKPIFSNNNGFLIYAPAPRL